jgi:NAD+-dependent protein deacetylase sirtuin 2
LKIADVSKISNIRHNKPTIMRTAPADIAGLARFILSNDCQSIAILTGAGVSVASGIPDFRSPGGMYDTLRPELITASEHERRLLKQDPTNVVSWDMFRNNAFPYLEVRRPFILGTRDRKWKTTIAHRFAELLHAKTNKLTRIYTQNIDGLDLQCDEIPRDKIVTIHGTIGASACEGCGEEADHDAFCEQVRTNIKDIYQLDPDAHVESTPILCKNCHKPLVKPRTVLFGRNLPPEFFLCAEQDLPKLDLLIVAGTSLVVSPANSLVPAVPKKTIRVIVNRDPVGSELGIVYQENPSDGRDFFAQGECDEVFLELTKELGWLDDLKEEELSPESAHRVRKMLRDSAYTKWF